MRVLLEFKLVRRFRRSPRRILVKFTSWAAIAGLTLGIASLIIAQSLARGFQSELQEKLLANTAHITVAREDREPIASWKTASETIGKVSGVVSVTGEHSEPAVLVGPISTEFAVLRVSDMNPDFPGVIEPSRVSVAVGRELARSVGIYQSFGHELLTFSGISSPRRTPVGIANEFSTGIQDYDSSWIRISAAEYSRMTGKAFVPSSLNISVSEIYNAPEIAAAIGQGLGAEYRVTDWQEANKPLFAALSFEKKAATAVIWLIILIAALNITTTLALLVSERRVDIAVLRTCGAKTQTLISIFVLEGLTIGAAGIAAGVSLGVALCFTANRFRLFSIPADVYSLNYIPLKPETFDIIMTAAAALAISALAACFPAISAAAIKPMENLRNQ